MIDAWQARVLQLFCKRIVTATSATAHRPGLLARRIHRLEELAGFISECVKTHLRSSLSCRPRQATLSTNARHVCLGLQSRSPRAGPISRSARYGSSSYSAPPRHSTLGWTNRASSRLVLPDVVMSDEDTRTQWNPSVSHVSARKHARDRSRTSMNAPYSQNGSHSNSGRFARSDTIIVYVSRVQTPGGRKQTTDNPWASDENRHISSPRRFEIA